MLHLDFLTPSQPPKKHHFLHRQKPRPIQTSPQTTHTSLHLPTSPPRAPKKPARRVRFDLPPTPTTPIPPSQCSPTTTSPKPRDIPLEAIPKPVPKVKGKNLFLPQSTPTPTLPQILAEIRMLAASETDPLLRDLLDLLSRSPPPQPAPKCAFHRKDCPVCPATEPPMKVLEKSLLRIFTARGGVRYATGQLVAALVRHGLVEEEVVHHEYDLDELEWEAERWVERIMAGRGMQGSCGIGGLEGLVGLELPEGEGKKRVLIKEEVEEIGRYDAHVRWLACVLARAGRKVGFRADRVLEVLGRFD